MLCRNVVLFLLMLASPGYAAPEPDLVAAAESQVGVTVMYDPSYQKLSYPGGDVPIERGVCTDVVVRAYRKLGVDLQVLVNRDMQRAWSAYPRKWGLRRPDPNIDHRRVPNLATFFARHGIALPVSGDASDYQPGDIVVWELPGALPHIGIVSHKRSARGVPLIVHNIGWGTRIEDVLFTYRITGHFRYPKMAAVSAPSVGRAAPAGR